LPWRPSEPGEVPTLGYECLDWLTENLARPELDEYEPFVPTREQAEFMLRFYELDPLTGKRKIRRGVISRPRGWGKSPFTAALACLEGLGPVTFAGWDADGRPVGQPWSRIRRPLVEIAAVSESQVDTNTWAPLLDMLTRGPVLENYPGVEPLGTFVNLPFGRIQKRTAAAGSAKGAPAVFVVCDQTEEWTPGNGGRNLFDKLKNNVIKRGGHLLESPNAFTPGMQSVAENSMQAYMAIRSGKARIDDGLMFDHREAPGSTDMLDGDSLMAGLAVAYGDSADVEHCAIHNPSCRKPGWVDLEHIRASIWEPDADMQVSRSDWLNQVTHASDSWLSRPEWMACADATKVVADREVITLGFDGSVRDDASALVACRVSDGHLMLLECWEKPDFSEKDWQIDRTAVDIAVAAAFERYTVLGFYCDPALWQDYVDRWTHRFGERLKVRASQQRPLEWWTNRPVAMVAALERFHTAVTSGALSHEGDSLLTEHVLNARTRISRAGTTIGKDSPKSPRKIDAAMAATLAYECRSDAVAAGATPDAPRATFVPRRIY
jgi:hypothetical protein